TDASVRLDVCCVNTPPVVHGRTLARHWRCATLVRKLEDDLTWAYQTELLTGDFLDISKITTQPLYFTGQGSVLLFDDLNLTHQSIEFVLRAPHRQQTTIAPHREGHHGQQKQTAHDEHQGEPGGGYNLTHQTRLWQLRV